LSAELLATFQIWRNPAFLRFWRSRLRLRQIDDGRAAANLGIVTAHFAGAVPRHQPGQWFPRQTGEREVDDVGVGEEVVKERLDRIQRVRSAQLEQHHPDFVSSGH